MHIQIKSICIIIIIENNKKSGIIIDNKLTDLQNANMFNSYF